MSEIAALGFSYQVVLDKDARRTIVAQTHVPADASQAIVDAILDKVARATDRQAAYYELQEARVALAHHLSQAKEIQTQLVAMEEKARVEFEADDRRRGTWSPERLDSKERAARTNLEISLNKWRGGAERYQADIERLEPLVNGHAHDLGSNSHAGGTGG